MEMVGDGERVEMVGGEEVSSTSVGVFSLVAGGGGEEVSSTSVRGSSMLAGDGDEGFGAGDDCLELLMVGVFSVVAGGDGEEVSSTSVRRSSISVGDGDEGFGAGDDCLELLMTAGVSESSEELLSSLEFVFEDDEDDCDDGVQLRFFLNKKWLFWCHLINLE